jgi:hypothetical protein
MTASSAVPSTGNGARRGRASAVSGALVLVLSALLAGVLPASASAAGRHPAGGRTAGQAGQAVSRTVSAWKLQTMPVPRGAARVLPASVSCVSATDCTAVGYWADQNGFEYTLVEAWNGSAWSLRRSPNIARTPYNVLHRVWCGSAKACMAVGNSTNGAGLPAPLAETWNGSAWTITRRAPLPAGATSAQFAGVWCVAAASCLAVGEYIEHHGPQFPLAETWNGSTWSILAVSEPPKAAYGVLSKVFCSSPARCVAVGYYANPGRSPVAWADSLSGRRWTISYPPLPPSAVSSQLISVWCTATRACTAAGDYSTTKYDYLGFAATWNGRAWTLHVPARPGGVVRDPLIDLWCATPTACTAVGYLARKTAVVSLAETWNGTTWSRQATPNPARSPYTALTGISCRPSFCETVGYYQRSGTYWPVAMVRR